MELPKRKSNRLKNYDYSQNGAYFVTICTHNKEHFFATIVGSTKSKVFSTTNVLPTTNALSTTNALPTTHVGATCGRQLTKYGIIVDNEINKINNIYGETIKIDKYVVMPNHIHLIIMIENIDGRPKVSPTISRIIQQFKGSVTKQIGFAVWQKSFHEHVIRNEKTYQEIWKYIDNNPLKWELDCYYTNL